MPRPTLLTAIIVGLAVTVLVGCAAAVTGVPAPAENAQRLQPELSTPPPPPTTTTPAGPTRNARGMIPKKLGEPAGLGDTDRTLATFTITTAEVDPPCHEFGSPPENGHTLLLTVTASTGSDAEAAQALSFLLNPFNFAEIGKDGVTRPAQMGICTDFERHLPLEFGINQKYSGPIELAVPEASGTLSLQDSLVDTGGGWEWTYPR